MAGAVWLHIGTPKSGTSSLQKYFHGAREALASQGLAYLAPDGRASSNELAQAINRPRGDPSGLAAALNSAIEAAPQAAALVSSEMFYGVDPARLFKLLPALASRPVHVLVYLRRQDRYIEAAYLQKSKNGRFSGTIQDYIARFDGSGSDYAAILAPWQAMGPNVRLVPRVLERARLQGGEVVADACAQIGLPPPPSEAEVNVSPGLHRVQLLQAAQAAGLGNPRRLQRLWAARFPQDPGDRAPILSAADRRAFVARFAEGNEMLRARFFPDWESLFDDTGYEAAGGISPFTEEQLAEISGLFQVMREAGALD